MKKYYNIFTLCIVVSLIVSGVLVINALITKPSYNLLRDCTIKIDSWTYYTSLDRSIKKATLPWKPKYREGSMTIYMNSKLPKLHRDKTLFIKSYMKQIKVLINGRQIYDSRADNDKGDVNDYGMGFHYLEIPRNYTEANIQIQVFSRFPQNVGRIEQISIGSKADHIGNAIGESGVSNLMALGMILIGVFSISTFLNTFLRNSKYINLLCIGIFTLICGSWIIAETDLYQIFYNNSYIGYVIEYIAFYSMPIPLLIFIITNYPIKHKRIIMFLISTLTIFLTFIICTSAFGLMELHQGIKFYHSILGISLILLICVLSLEVTIHDKDFILFFLGCILMIMFGSIDLIEFYSKPEKSSFNHFYVGMFIFTLTILINVARYIIKLKDEKVRNETLMDIAYKDISTGLLNRRAFDETIQRLNEELKNHSNITVIVVDLDNLKETNDYHGHIHGDRIIFLSASILNWAFKDIGEVYRIGGDEFAILCVDKSLEEVEDCEVKTRNFIKEIEFNCKKDVSMSSGKAAYDSSIDRDIYSVFSRADKYMYKNKRKRKEGYYI
ncbi:GGDEF domain-containing protein [Clostridium cylindrosporum]|nr:GGDEF domain-containing protein [Clostridium cylindrosporum]